MMRISRFLKITGIIAGMWMIFPIGAHAATLSFSPQTKNVNVGDTFTVTVRVSSPDQPMNAASGDISFPSTLLRAVSISKSNSIIDLWVRDPSFLNSNPVGNIHFEGVVLNPGYEGSGGVVLQAVFKAIDTGDASLSFSSAQVLANDGQGTNILESRGAGTYSISPRPIEREPVTTGTVPAEVTSTELTSTIPQIVLETTTPIVSVNGGSSEDALLLWGIVIFLFLLWVTALIMIIYYLMNRSRRTIIRERKELRDDLKRIEKELGDVSVSGIRRKQDAIEREIKHLERDIERDR